MSVIELLDKKIHEVVFDKHSPNTNTIITNACAAHNVITVRDLLRVKLSEIIDWKTIGGKTFDLLLKFLEKNRLLVTVEEAYIQTLKNMEKDKEENMENTPSDIWEERLYNSAQKTMLILVERLLEFKPTPLENLNTEKIAEKSVMAAKSLVDKLRKLDCNPKTDEL